jgi:outer membrane protein TolC
MTGRSLILGLCLAAAGCARLRTAPEPAPAPSAPRPEPPARPAKLEGPIDIAASVDWATQHAPSLRTARARADAAGAGIDLADTAYLPRLDFLWQEIRATRNNISGTTLPQGVIPGISGPVNKTKSWDSGWGSNAGALLTYEPIDFGLRSANALRMASSLAQAPATQARVSTEAAIARRAPRGDVMRVP